MRRLSVVLLCCGLWLAPLGADDAPAPAAPKVDLTQDQQAVLRDYQGFEKRLAELGESLRGSDLDRANLLLQARSESQRQQVQSRMEEIVAILNNQRPFADAVERQQMVVTHMEAILRILQTDAERDRLQARIKELEQILKSTNRVIAAQKDVRADTERGKEFDSLEKAEQRVRDSARNLAEEIDQKDARRSTPGEEGSGEEPSSGQENSPNEGESAPMPGEKQPGEKQPGDNQKGDPESPMPGDTSPMDPSQPGDSSQGQQSQGQQSQGQQSQGQQSQGQQSEGQQSEGQQSEGQPSPGQQSQSPESEPQGKPPQPQGGDSQGERTPGRQELEEAQRAMEKAIEELKQQQRDNASNEQDQAIAQLEAMKAKIEEILRQLREEERELHLTMLEARFQEMLKLQLRINADTVRLDARPAAERGEAHFTKSRDLSRQEQQNVLSAEKALALLKEEGSSVAFPEAVEQMQSNMAAVAVRLTKGDTGETTQLLEKLIVESLEEMVLSLQKELEQIKQDQQQQQPGQQGGQQNRRLVEQLAELKMIRSLQNQVNRLTKQVGLQIEGEQAEDADTVHLLRDLARRQQRIQDATYDLSIGRNQ